jgi:hypothetical protein
MAAETVEQGGPSPAQEFEFGPVDYDRVRQHVITQLGRDYITYGGLVELLHQVSEGYFAIDTQLIQAPTQDNGQVAICSAQVLVYDPENPDVVRRRATGIGDASPANVNRMMATHLIRMAETRAKARALRDCVNVGMVSFEELGPAGADDEARLGDRQAVSSEAPSTPRGPGPPERIMVAGRAYNRAQVWSAYRQRLAEARAAGLVLPDDQADLREDAALSALAGASQAIRRRLEARDGTGK